jgi:WD40 repeat protein
MASGGGDENSVKLWDTSTWQLQTTLRGHTAPVKAIAISPEAEMLASASGDSTLKLWDMDSGELLHCLRHPRPLGTVAFDPQGKRVAAGGEFHTVCIWDADSGKMLNDFHAHWARVRSLTFGNDGETLLTASNDNTTRVWALADLPDAATAESEGPVPRTTFVVHEDWSMWCAFSSGDKNLLGAAGMAPYDTRIWNLNDLSIVAKFNARQDNEGYVFQQCMAFVGDQPTLAMCLSRKGRPGIALWDPPRQLQRFEPSSIPSNQSKYSTARMAISADGKSLVIASELERLITRFDMATRKTKWCVESEYGEPSSIAFNAADQVVAVGTSSGSIMFLDAATGRKQHGVLKHDDGRVEALAFSSTGLLASSGQEGLIKVWDMESFTAVELPEIDSESVHAACFSPDASLLATASGVGYGVAVPHPNQGEVCLWDVEKQRLLTRFHAHYGCVTCVVFSPAGESIATTGRDGKVHLWDVQELLEFGRSK